MAGSLDSNTIQLGPGIHEEIVIPSGAKGLSIIGTGRDGDQATIVKGLKVNGLWYSTISNIRFQPEFASDVVVDIDGGPFGVQGNTFSNCMFHGKGLYDNKPSRTAFFMGRQFSNVQGSENVFLNCHFSGAETCYVQKGYNALNNTFIGGNFQDYINGIIAYFGSFSVFNTGFQSVNVKDQIADGWDIRADSGGVADQINIIGCRTESIKFYKGGASQPVTIMGCTQSVDTRTLLPEYRLNGTLEVDSNLTGEWQTADVACIDIHNGTLINISFPYGKIKQSHNNMDRGIESRNNIIMTPDISFVAIDCSNGAKSVFLPNPQEVPHGQEISVIRIDNTTNVATIHSLHINNLNWHQIALSSGSTRMLKFKALGGGNLPRRWYLLTPLSRLV